MLEIFISNFLFFYRLVFLDAFLLLLIIIGLSGLTVVKFFLGGVVTNTIKVLRSIEKKYFSNVGAAKHFIRLLNKLLGCVTRGFLILRTTLNIAHLLRFFFKFPEVLEHWFFFHRGVYNYLYYIRNCLCAV